MSKEKEKKKIKIPKAVSELKLSPKKFAKKHDIKLRGKGLSKGDKKRNIKKLKKVYSEAAIDGLNKAVKILADHSPDNKKVLKVQDGVDNIISNPEVMKSIAKLYKKDPKNYNNLKYLPHMIMNTLMYYNQESISDEEKEIGKALNTEELVAFCEKILKEEIKRYRKLGLSTNVAYRLATVIPTTKLLKNSRQWYKKLIQAIYDIAGESEESSIDVGVIISAVCKVDKNKCINKKDFLEMFFSEFILTKSSNKNHSFNDCQKELHETLIEKTLEYLDGIKDRKTKDILKTYIKRRKTAESYKNDTKRVIKFIDYANSNSSFTNIKSVVQELISDNSSNELYLS